MIRTAARRHPFVAVTAAAFVMGLVAGCSGTVEEPQATVSPTPQVSITGAQFKPAVVVNSARTHDDYQDVYSMPWLLVSAAPSSREVRLVASEGDSSTAACYPNAGVRVDEQASQVVIEVFSVGNGADTCASVLTLSWLSVPLSQPLGDRALVHAAVRAPAGYTTEYLRRSIPTLPSGG